MSVFVIRHGRDAVNGISLITSLTLVHKDVDMRRSCLYNHLLRTLEGCSRNHGVSVEVQGSS